MSEELKTLKDIEFYEADSQSQVEWKLRQEAIKWIKVLREQPLLYATKQFYNYNVIEWIKHFFNITDEDLK